MHAAPHLKTPRPYKLKRMDDMKILHTQEDFVEMLEHSKREPVILYKHSASCPISARAQEKMADIKHDLPVYTLTVQYARDLSKHAAETLGVTHQTPQAIVIKNSEAKQDFSHGMIKSETVSDAVAEVAG